MTTVSGASLADHRRRRRADFSPSRRTARRGETRRLARAALLAPVVQSAPDMLVRPRLRFASFFVGFVLLACSSRQENEGCGSNIGERPCDDDADCEGFTGEISFFGGRDPRCMFARCRDGLCVATPRSGVIADDTKGDCQRAICDDGHAQMAFSRSDTPPPPSECMVSTCEPSSFPFSVAMISSRPAADGTTCVLGSGTGECRSGACVEPAIFDAGPDKDAGDDDAGPDLDAGEDADAE
jgi:hypothetical protein